MINNNLFYYATKELSQDAFICWLCSYALEGAEIRDKAVWKCSQRIVREFSGAKEGDQVILRKIERQIGNIDVLLTVEINGVINKIIIEDKTHSKERNNQLVRYYEKQTKSSGKGSVVKGVYFKTGFQDDYSAVKAAGYTIIDRKRILELLREYAETTTSDILRDYYTYWLNFEEMTQSYTQKNLRDWDWRAINGFFEDTKKKLLDQHVDYWCGYGHVSNKSGGFWGFWYGPSDDRINFEGTVAELYLQLQISWNNDSNNEGYEYKQCLKLKEISNNGEGSIRKIRDKILNIEKEHGFRKLEKLRLGCHMTVGIYNDFGVESNYKQITDVMLNSIRGYKEILKIMRETNI